MATGNYGVIRPADVSIDDIEVFYTYSPSRDTPPTVGVERLTSSQVLSPISHPDQVNGTNPVFGGLYNLTLPSNIFSAKGVYNIIIRPKEIRIPLDSVGVLSAFPDTKGIIIDTTNTNFPSNLSANDALIGYRVEYYGDDGSKIPNLFRIITSSNRVEPVNQNLNNSAKKAVTYRFRDTSTLLFCTVTPSSTPSVAPNKEPFIGNAGGQIVLTNTFFNPIMVELEMAEHDLDTLGYGLYGNQIKSIVDGKYTIYDGSNNIYKQYNLYEIQDEVTSEPLHEVREEVTNIDFTKDFDDITNLPQ